MYTFMKPAPLVWIVDSEYTGELTARIGLAEHLGFGYERIPRPSDNQDEYHDLLKKRYLQRGGYQTIFIISGTGEETTSEIADLRKIFPKQLFTIFLASILPETPHPRLTEYDLIASPQLTGENVVSLLGVPHNQTKNKLAHAALEHKGYFHALTQPIIGLLIGGNTRYCNGFNETYARHFAQQVVHISQSLKAVLVITNSRRTPVQSMSMMLTEFSQLPYDFFDWQTSRPSFYSALLAHAELFIVTGDSLSMCSEAVFTGKPVLVDLNEKVTECYHRDIIGKLIEHGAAKKLSTDYEPWTYPVIDTTQQIAEAILQRSHATLHSRDLSRAV